LGSLELVQKRVSPDPKVRALIDNAVQGAQRGTALTQRMLAFARRQEISLEPVELTRLVAGMSELLDRSLGPAVSIERRFPKVLPPVRADANQLELALLNLAVNARDAMPDGGTITISAREADVGASDSTGLPAGRYVCLSVADTGEGMDEAVLARAMEPFFTTKGVGRGTGLGLPMVSNVVEQFGGRVVLSSRKGQGTTAELWLPVAEEGGAPRAAPASAQPQPAHLPLTILAVDDDSLVLMNTAAMLEDLGHTVVTATSGGQALERLRGEPSIQLVITDQAMPGMSGAQLVAAIRAERPSMRIILATGYAELPADVDIGVPLLSKPFTQSDLERVLAA
ncbi:MAG: ATP-binding protein, partial [Alphaproteobacteria bacterium]